MYSNLELSALTTEKLRRKELHYQIETFPSGAVMIDFSHSGRGYCIQIAEGLIGLSETEESDLSTVPDSGYLDWEALVPLLDHVLGSDA